MSKKKTLLEVDFENCTDHNIRLHDKAESFINQFMKDWKDRKIDVSLILEKKMKTLIRELNYPLKESNRIL